MIIQQWLDMACEVYLHPLEVIDANPLCILRGVDADST